MQYNIRYEKAIVIALLLKDKEVKEIDTLAI